jgi:sugar phosphate isomerase/epimerase
MLYTRRDVGKIALASLPLATALGATRAFGAPKGPNSKINGVQIGVISYSFRGMPNVDVDQVIKVMVQIGLSEVELMSEHAEAAAGAPSGRGGFPGGGQGRAPGAAAGAPGAAGGAGAGAQAAAGQGRAPGAAAGAPGAAAAGGAGPQAGAAPGRAPGAGGMQMSPEQQAAMRNRAEELRKWRQSVSMDKFKAVRKRFADAGIDLALLCYNMNDRMTDEDIEYGFQMAKGLGVKGITTSTTVSMSKRIAPLADKHKMLVGYHGHDQTSDPNQFATLESYYTAFTYGKYNGVNLDIGHFTASNYDAIAFIKEHHARITNLHIKDRKKNHGPNTPFGQGDTPIKDVLQLLRKEKYHFPANIEYEYRGESDIVTEVTKCFEFCKNALA